MSQKDQIQDHTESLTDLPLTIEQAEQTKAAVGTQLFGEGKQVKIDFCKTN